MSYGTTKVTCDGKDCKAYIDVAVGPGYDTFTDAVDDVIRREFPDWVVVLGYDEHLCPQCEDQEGLEGVGT